MNGIYSAVITPCDRDGNIDTERYVRHANWLIANGCHGLGVFGTTSETNCYSAAERQAALETYVVAGLDPASMILGVGCCARGDTVALARHGLANGVTKMLVLPPFFYKNNSDEGLIRAYSEVIETIDDDRLEFYFYHFPQVSQVPVTKPVIAALLERYPGIVKGLKDSSGDWAHTRDLIESFPGFEVFSGADDHLLDNLRTGGAGTISAAGNLNCAANRIVFDAFMNGDEAAAEAAMGAVADVRRIVSGFPLVPAIKHVIAEAHGDSEWARVRPPLVELGEAAGTKLMADLAGVGFRFDPGSA
ncbi:MAG: dihydrodipicolinate synthase family protein [Geminicoccaceae bacterium]